MLLGDVLCTPCNHSSFILKEQKRVLITINELNYRRVLQPLLLPADACVSCTKHKDGYASSFKPSFLSRLGSPSQDQMESQENFKVAEGRGSKQRARTNRTLLPP